MGAIPKQLRLIFRDRHDFDAGGTLAAQTAPALHNLGALILIASPAAAKSNPVNEGVRLFVSPHPDRPVIPLIIEDDPGHLDRECFPPALYWPPPYVMAATDASWRLPRLSPG